MFLLIYTVLSHAAALHGFGFPNPDEPSPNIDFLVRGMYLQTIAQTFAVLGMAIAKMSLGVFHIRLVRLLWHKIVIWIAISTLAVVSVLCAIMVWVHDLPLGAVYDLRIKATWSTPIEPFGIVLSGKSYTYERDGLHILEYGCQVVRGQLSASRARLIFS